MLHKMSQPQHNETLKFKIVLSGTFWDKKPAFSVWVDDVAYASGSIESAEHCNIEFEASLVEDAQHELKIRLENKNDTDTVVVDNTIVKDMLLNIESIEVDDIELGNIKWSNSIFIPDDKENRPVLKSCLNLGWNGAYTISFTSPFYIWLLENF